MTLALSRPRPTTITIDVELAPVRPVARLMPCHDVRTLGLATASDMLQAKVADLDIVHFARARADVRFCPFCSKPHPD
jgi:hypothetical protein